MKLICLVLLLAFATAELGKYNFNFNLEFHVNTVKTNIITYFSIGNTLQNVDVVDVDEIEDPKESLDKIEEGNIKLQTGITWEFKQN